MKFEQLTVGPDTHCWDDDTGRDCWSYSPELVAQMLEAERERAATVAESWTEYYVSVPSIGPRIAFAIRAQK